MELKERIKKIVSHHFHGIDERVLFCRLCDIEPELFNLNVSSIKFAEEVVEYAEKNNNIKSLIIVLSAMHLKVKDIEIHENERVIQGFEPNMIDYTKIDRYLFSRTLYVISNNFSYSQLNIFIRLFNLSFAKLPAEGQYSSYVISFLNQLIVTNKLNQLKFYCRKLDIDLQLPQ